MIGGDWYRLTQSTSTSFNMGVGLEFAFKNPDRIPVLFIFLIKNIELYEGV